MMIQVDRPDEVVITNVVKNGPAAQAGFGDDDILINFGGQVVTNVDSFNAAFKAHAKVGAGVPVTFLRDGDKNQPVDAMLSVSSVAQKHANAEAEQEEPKEEVTEEAVPQAEEVEDQQPEDDVEAVAVEEEEEEPVDV
eukprot:TRINITY_DN641_c0_g1_i2.p2 TRINITY_DN641_c0_g1~~TRINITY_DN641_c0_g1_i2.p2  ORF type:complete len:138 (+),score=54.60 TRINITY_DN641_c0_g1_i2:583-996(+)